MAELTVFIYKKSSFWLLDFLGWDLKIRKLDFWLSCSQIQPEFGEMAGKQLEKVDFSALVTSTIISNTL